MSKAPDKPFKIYRMEETTEQPSRVQDYILSRNRSFSVAVLMGMFSRLVAILVSNQLLSAADVQFIASGLHIPGTKFSSWTPQQEIDEGRPIQTIKEVG